VNSKENLQLFEMAKKYFTQAYAPYSKFSVGAALECKDHSLFGGHNIENASYGACVCAERVAILKAVSEGQRRGDFKKIALVTEPKATPCGMCLQVMAEFFNPETEIIVCTPKGIQEVVTFSRLLPNPFDPLCLPSQK
jgi:cytidine deaminase